MNSITFDGRLAADAELRYTPAVSRYCRSA